MKVRRGFVSNSSSSSFVLFVKDESLTAEERKSRSMKIYKEYYGDEYWEELKEEVEKWRRRLYS